MLKITSKMSSENMLMLNPIDKIAKVWYNE